MDKYNEFRTSFKIRKGKSEAVNRWWTDITMVKIKRTKGQVIIYKTLQSKQRVEQNEPN